MKKGVIFTLDALVAVVIALMALTIIAQLLSLRTGGWYKEIALYNSAQDFLTSRDKDGTLLSIFNSTNAAAISNLNSLIALQVPPSMVANINITICSYQTNTFVCSRNFAAGQTSNSTVGSVVRRVFTDPANNHYGIAVMEVWYK